MCLMLKGSHFCNDYGVINFNFPPFQTEAWQKFQCFFTPVGRTKDQVVVVVVVVVVLVIAIIVGGGGAKAVSTPFFVADCGFVHFVGKPALT